jgi:hypothetical protein
MRRIADEERGQIREEMVAGGELKKGNQANGWAITGPGGKFMKIYS